MNFVSQIKQETALWKKKGNYKENQQWAFHRERSHQGTKTDDIINCSDR